MDIFANLLAEREKLRADLGAIKAGAAEISQLLADEMLSGEDWDEAVRVLGRCRAERKRLDDRILHIDVTITLLTPTPAQTTGSGEHFR
jgi:hypothetical protein